MSDLYGSDDSKWTVRGVPNTVRDMVVARAKLFSISIGECLSDAVHKQNRLDNPGYDVLDATRTSAETLPITVWLDAASRFSVASGRPMRADLRRKGNDLLSEVAPPAHNPNRPRRKPPQRRLISHDVSDQGESSATVQAVLARADTP